MVNLWNQGIKSLTKEKTIEKLNKEREKKMLHMSRHILSEEGNPIYEGIDVVFVSTPSPQEKNRILGETNPVHTSTIPPINIPSRQVFVDN